MEQAKQHRQSNAPSRRHSQCHPDRHGQSSEPEHKPCCACQHKDRHPAKDESQETNPSSPSQQACST